MKNMDLLERSTALFSSWGAGDGLAVVLGHVVALLLLVGVAFLADVICRHVVLKAVAKVVRHTKAKWDDVVFDHKVMVRLSHMVMPVVIYVFIPSVFSGSSLWAVDLVQRICFVFIVVSFLLFVHAFLKAVYSIYSDKESFRNRPLKSMMQTVQVAMWFVVGRIGCFGGRPDVDFQGQHHGLRERHPAFGERHAEGGRLDQDAQV